MNLEGLSVPTQWKLDDGLALIRALQPLTRKYGYHVALGGGVLNKGFSDKDLDLYFLPMGGGIVIANPENLVDWLIGMWGPGDEIGHNLYPAEPPYIQRLTFQYSKQRIDVFVLGATGTPEFKVAKARLEYDEEPQEGIFGAVGIPRVGRAPFLPAAQESLRDAVYRFNPYAYSPPVQSRAAVFVDNDTTTTTTEGHNTRAGRTSPGVPAQPTIFDSISADNEGSAGGGH